MASHSSELISVEDFVNNLSLKNYDKSQILSILIANEIELEDLLSMKSQTELEELELGLNSRLMNGIWDGIKILQDVQSSNDTEDLLKLDSIPNMNCNSSCNSNCNSNWEPDPTLRNKEKDISGGTGTGTGDGDLDLNTHSKKDFNEYKIQKGGMTGLHNQGNTCFMNSAIQCLLHIPGFTDALANEIISSSNNNDVSGDIDIGDEKENYNGFNTKNEWICSLKENDFVDVYCAHPKYRTWYAAEITGIEFKQKTNNNNNSNKNRNKNKNKNKKKNKENISQSECMIKVEYRTFKDCDELNVLNETDINYIDPPNTHSKESVYCEHWRHDLTFNSKIDYLDSNRSKWVVGDIIDHLPKKGFKLEYHNGRRFQTAIVRRFDTKGVIAEFGRKTGNDGNDGNDLYNNSNYNGGGSVWYNPFSWGSGNGSNSRYNLSSISFCDAWLDIINRVHLRQNSSSFTPSLIYDKMSSYDPGLGDKRQHDAIEALTVILDGIKESLPLKFQYITDETRIGDELYPFSMPNSIYDKEFEWDFKTDGELCQTLIETNQINFGNNLVSQYFDGIEVIKETCLNCGIQRRLYRVFRELSLPVTSNGNVVNVNIFYYSKIQSKYIGLCLKIPIDCNVLMLKFLSLCKMMEKANMGSKLDKFEIILLNEQFIDEMDNNFITIMNDKDKVSDYSCTNGVFLVVPKINIDISTNKLNRNINSVRTVYGHLNNEKNELLFCVLLLLTNGSFNHKTFKTQLEESEDTFLQHIKNGSQKNNNGKITKRKNGKRKQNNNNDKSLNGIKFDDESFSTFCNGEVNDHNKDSYFLNGRSKNVIIGYFDGKKENKHNKDNQGMFDEDYDDSKNNAVNDVNDSSHFENYNVSFMTNEEQACYYIVEKEIELFKSRQGAIKHLKNEIDKLKKSILFKKQLESGRRNSKQSKQNKKKSGHWFSKIELKYPTETSVPLRLEENLLEANRVWHYRLKKFEITKENVVSNIQETFKMFWKNFNVSRFNSGINLKKKRNKQLRNLTECLTEYQSIKYMEKNELAPKFSCNCDANNSVPFVESQTRVIIHPQALIVSFARGKGDSKNNHNIDFKENMVMEKDNMYNLRAVCKHFGNGTAFGHYTATVKQLGTDIWYECDDNSYFRKNSHQTSNAMMMIYTKN